MPSVNTVKYLNLYFIGTVGSDFVETKWIYVFAPSEKSKVPVASTAAAVTSSSYTILVSTTKHFVLSSTS